MVVVFIHFKDKSREFLIDFFFFQHHLFLFAKKNHILPQDHAGSSVVSDLCWTWEIGSSAGWQQAPERRKVARSHASQAVPMEDGRFFLAGGFTGLIGQLPYKNVFREISRFSSLQTRKM